MTDMLCRSWWLPALRGLLAIAFGVLALIWPGLTLLGLLSMFAAYAVLGGVLGVAVGFHYRHTHDDWWLPLLLGVATLGAGIIAVIHPGLTLMVLALLIGANALVSGILDLSMAIRLRKTIHHESLLVLNAVVSIIFGIVVFLFPGTGALAMVWMISLYALTTGIMLLFLGFRLRSVTAGQNAIQQERRVVPDRRMAHAH